MAKEIDRAIDRALGPEYVVTVQQEIGRVRWDREGGEPMLKVAFGLACDHFAEAATEEAQTFDYQIEVGDGKDVHLRVTG